jgi:hypothetical protein
VHSFHDGAQEDITLEEDAGMCPLWHYAPEIVILLEHADCRFQMPELVFQGFHLALALSEVKGDAPVLLHQRRHKARLP